MVALISKGLTQLPFTSGTREYFLEAAIGAVGVVACIWATALSAIKINEVGLIILFISSSIILLLGNYMYFLLPSVLNILLAIIMVIKIYKENILIHRNEELDNNQGCEE